MAFTRKLSDGSTVVDLVEEINLIDNQFGFVRAKNWFNIKPTTATSINFDRKENSIVLLPSSDRGTGKSTHGKDDVVETFSIPLAYFKSDDKITPQDIQDQRMPGTDMADTLNNVRMEKLTNLRNASDQTDEFLRIEAMKGTFRTPDGRYSVNMYEKFGITQEVVDFDFGTPETSVDTKIKQLRKAIFSNLKSGAATGVPTVICGDSFFEGLINDSQVRASYESYQNAGVQRLRDDLAQYYAFGVVDSFEHRGMLFINYNPEFVLSTGVTEKPFDDESGIAFAAGARDLFRGYNGPANRIELANTKGRPLYVFEFRDARDTGHTIELESAPLYFCTKPASVIKVTTSTL